MFGLWTGGLMSKVMRPSMRRAVQKRGSAGGGAESSAMTLGITISSKISSISLCRPDYCCAALSR